MRQWLRNRLNLRRLCVVAFSLLFVVSVAGCGSGGNGSGESGSESYTLQFSSYLGTGSQGKVYRAWIKDIEKRSNGRIKIEPHWEGSLLSGDESLAGTQDGRTDIGHVTATYNPSELPLSQVSALPFLSTNSRVDSATFNTLYKEYKPYHQEWESQGVHVLTFYGVPSTILGSVEPVENLQSLEGKKIRGLGYTSQAVEAIGANATSLEVNELYEALQRGVIDGYTGMLLDLAPDLGLDEVAPHVVDTGLGTYTINSVVINSSSWNQLPEDLKKIINEETAQLPDAFYKQFQTATQKGCEVFHKDGRSVTELSAEDRKRWKQAIGNSITKEWLKSTSQAGADGEAFYKEYQRVLENKQDKLADDHPSVLAQCVGRGSEAAEGASHSQ